MLALLTACGGSSNTLPSQQLTLDQKVGQMVMMGVDGTAADEPGVQQALAQVGAGQLGGVILYATTSPARHKCVP